jgi:hypothetical protein
LGSLSYWRQSQNLRQGSSIFDDLLRDAIGKAPHFLFDPFGGWQSDASGMVRAPRPRRALPGDQAWFVDQVVS